MANAWKRALSLLAALDRARLIFCASLCCRAVPPSNDASNTAAQQPLLSELTPPTAKEEPFDISTATLMHHTTVAIIPPDAAWPPIQAARNLVRDRGLWRWPPHANLLYPFVAPRAFYHAAHHLAGPLRSVEPFDVTLKEMRLFVHSKRSATLWLHPEPSRPDALIELQAALQNAIPQADAQTAQHGGTFTAHFTIGHFGGEEAAIAARDAILAEEDLWPSEGVSFTVDSVLLMARDGPDGQFEPRWSVPLGGGGGGVPKAYERGEPFALMPREMPEFCVRDTNKRNNRRGRGKGRAKRSPSPQRTEEEIAQLRAERAAKRERLNTPPHVEGPGRNN